MSFIPTSPANKNNLTSFQKELTNLTKEGVLGSYLVVEKDGSLHQTNGIRAFWENIRELFGYTNRTDASLVKNAAARLISSHLGELNDSAELVAALAKKVGLIPQNAQFANKHQLIQKIIQEAFETSPASPPKIDLSEREINQFVDVPHDTTTVAQDIIVQNPVPKPIEPPQEEEVQRENQDYQEEGSATSEKESDQQELPFQTNEKPQEIEIQNTIDESNAPVVDVSELQIPKMPKYKEEKDAEPSSAQPPVVEENIEKRATKPIKTAEILLSDDSKSGWGKLGSFALGIIAGLGAAYALYNVMGTATLPSGTTDVVDFPPSTDIPQTLNQTNVTWIYPPKSDIPSQFPVIDQTIEDKIYPLPQIEDETALVSNTTAIPLIEANGIRDKIVKNEEIFQVKQAEILKRENKQLILDTINQPSQVPSDKILANLIALYRPDLKDAKIAESRLEGLPVREPLTYLMSTMKAYMTSLVNHPEFSSNCREESCSAILGNFPLSHQLYRDEDYIRSVLEKMEFALELHDSSPIKQAQMILNRFQKIQPHENFFLPIAWEGDPVGHALVLEIEKDPNELLTMRIFNLGEGAQYHASSPQRILPFSELINVDPQRVAGGAFTSFLQKMDAPSPEGIKGWNSNILYEIAMASLGGEISSRQDSSELLRDPQYIGNCGMASTFAILDKNLVGNALAERMRALTMFRATNAYFEHDHNKFTQGPEREDRRKLIGFAFLTTYESIERAVETGGLTGEESQVLIKKTKEIEAQISKLQRNDLGTADQKLSFENYPPLSISSPKNTPKLYDINFAKQSFKGDNSPRDLSQAMQLASTPRTPTVIEIPALQDQATQRLLDYAKSINTLHGPSQSEIESPLDLDDLFKIGTQPSRDLISAANTESLKITETINLFRTRSSFFDADKLSILTKLIIDPVVFQKNLERDSGLIEALGIFCETGRKLGSSVESAETESFFAYLASLAQETIKKLPQDLVAKSNLHKLPNSQDIFAHLIEDCDHDDEIDRLKIIHYYRIKSLNLRASLTTEETGDLLSSVNFLKAKGYPTEFVNAGRLIKEVWDLVERSQVHFSDKKDANSILNEIARGVEPEHTDCEWIWHSLSKCYANTGQTMFYDPAQGILERQLLGRIAIPKSLATDSLFLAIAGSETERLNRIKDNVFVYNNQKGDNYRFVITEDGPIIQREFNHQWYQAADPKTIELPITLDKENLWHEGGILWHSVDRQGDMYFTGAGGKPILKLDKSSWGKYQAELVGPSWERTGLILTDFSNSPLSQIAARADDPRYIFGFSKNNEIAKVILPRLNLEFDEEQVNDRKILQCAQLDGYGLIPGSQALPLLGDFSSYLLLKKFGKKEKTAVLIPFLPLAEYDVGGLQTPTAFQAAAKTWETKVPYFFYKVENDILVPQVESRNEALQANSLVASIFLSEQRYEEAAKYLKTTDKLLKSVETLIDKEIVDQLISLATFFKINKDNSLDAATIRLQAASILYRLNNLQRIDSKEIKSFDEYMSSHREALEKDYAYYSRHVGRINDNLRLSKEQISILSTGLKKQTIPKPSAYAFPVPSDDQKLQHPALQIKDAGNNIPPALDVLTIDPRVFPADQTNHAGAIITSVDTLFVNAFPEGLLDLYEFLETPGDIGKKQIIKIARQFGLDESISPDDLKTTMMTLLELRYRYVAGLLNADPSLLSPEQLNKLNSEVNLVAALLRTGHVQDESFEKLEKDVEPHSKLLATFKTMPQYAPEVKAYKRFINTLSGDTLKSALDIWMKWVKPSADPIPLTVKNAEKVISGFIGPVQTSPMLEVSPISENEDEFRHSFAAYKPASFLYNSLSNVEREIQSCFAKTKIEAAKISSPFEMSNNLSEKNPAFAKIFKQYDDQLTDYNRKESESKYHYSLKDKALLEDQVDSLKESAKATDFNIQRFEQLLADKLNKASSDAALRAHKELKGARGAIRKLTFADAKAALAKGWDVEHLHAINPDLSVEDIQEIFHLTLSLMLERKENQRITRFIDGLNPLLKGDPKTDSWQQQADKLMKTLSFTNLYDPYDYPVLLLAETEFDIDLWPQQIPAIKRLAPRQQISALVQLAMGEGKTDVITPPVLCLLADGQTLPVLVLTEALVATVVPRLQERIGQGYNMEVRLIPIDRGIWTAEKIMALKNEFTTMIEQRIPLVWSSTDIQTLMNSFFESMKEFNRPPTADQLKITETWLGLFHLMKNSVEIMGDEFHKILDLLTSYALSLGNPQSVSADEMDAIIDFIRVVLLQRGLDGKGNFPLKTSDGSSLTEEYFNTVLKPQIVESIIERGIINNPRSKELLELMSQENVDLFRAYLTQPGKGIEKQSLFPALNKNDIEKISQKGFDDAPYIEETLKSLLPSDRAKLEIYLSTPELLATELKYLDEEYRRLDQKIYNYLAIQKESLRTVFALTSTSQFGKHYVLDKKGLSAIPADDGTPLWDAQFGNTLERGFLTSFLFHQTKIPRDYIIKDLEKFVQRYEEQFQNTFLEADVEGELDVGTLHNELTNEFRDRYGTSHSLKIRPFTSREIDKLYDWVNARFERQLPFIRDYILPEQRVYPTQIETSTHMFGTIAKKGFGIKGTTGTLNVDTFPLELQKNVYFSDTDPKVTSRIKTSSADKSISISIEGTPNEIVDKIYKTSTYGPGAIIDTTGLIKKDLTESYARTMLPLINQKNPQIKHMAYYEGDTIKVISIGIDQPSLYDIKTPQEGMIALWDVAHTTGSNILVNQNSHAFLILGKHIRFSELLQAVMRLRGLGSGQKLEFVISKQDRSIITKSLFDHLGIEIGKDQIPNVDQIIQYAVINEALEDSDKNWRAVDMRMRMALLDPIMDVLWNESTPPQNAIEIFNLVESLIVRNRDDQPWDQYGKSIGKQETQTALESLLESWMQHPVLNAIEKNPSLFTGVDVSAIKQNLKTIAGANHGLLPTEVESESTTGLKTREKEQTKVQTKEKTKIKEREKQKERIKVKVKTKEIINESERNIIEIRRKPFLAHSLIPPAKNPFNSPAFNIIPLNEALSLTQQKLNEMSSNGFGAAISAADLVNIDPSIGDVLKITDPDISFSLNLAPVWKNTQGVSPAYTPYSYFQKLASHALIIENKATKKIQVMAIDGNEAEAWSKSLMEDKQNPGKNNDFNLSLYHLHENRVIASGSTPVNAKNSLGTNARINELTAQVKLLSGITQYTKNEEKYLEHWIKARGSLTVLETFLFRIAAHREETQELFLKSKLGKIFQNNGISKKTIEKILESPFLANTKTMHKLLFDRSLTPKTWLKLAQKLKEDAGEDPKAFFAQWSDIVVPTLPVMYDNIGYDGAAKLRPQELEKFSFDFVQRRWLMNTFFPTLGDEFGAWKTAVPQMADTLPPLTRWEQLREWIEGKLGYPSDKGAGSDLTYLNNAFSHPNEAVSKSIASIDQLEAMSELSHPLWGLPSLSTTFNNVARWFGSSQLSADNAKFVEEASAIPSTYETHSKDIQRLAYSSLYLRPSLKALKDVPNYELERLFGIYHYLVESGIDPDAQRYAALLLAPRLHANKLGKDSLFYAQFISSLTINPSQYTKEEIENLLTNCYEAVKDVKEWKNVDPNHFLPSTEELSYSLRSLAVDAPEDVAKITAAWINQLLTSQNPNTASWLDMLLFQMVQRNEALIDHEGYKKYFAQSPADHMIRSLEYGKINSLTRDEIDILNKWELKDFDLFADLAKIPTISKPEFTVYDMAKKWAKVLGKASKEDAPQALWHKILGPIADQVKAVPPTTESDKASLRELVQAIDDYSRPSDSILNYFSSSSSDQTFEMLQFEVGNIRLAADYSFDIKKKQEFGLEEIKKLPTHSDPHMHKIYSYFIPNFMLTVDEVKNISPASLPKLFDDLHTVSLKHPKYTLEQWDTVFSRILGVFTRSGTNEQQETFFNWAIKFSQKGVSSEFGDTVVVITLGAHPEKMEHTSALAYVEGRENTIIDLLYNRHPDYYPDEMRKYVKYDFHLYGELFKIPTINRQPLAYDDFSTRIIKSLRTEGTESFADYIVGKGMSLANQFGFNWGTFDPSIIKDILETIYNRATKVDEGSRKKELISELIKTVETHAKNNYQKLIPATNQLRLISDYSSKNPNENIENAIKDLFQETEDNLRSASLQVLIPELSSGKGSQWIEPTLKAIATYSESLTKAQEETLKYLVANHGNEVTTEINKLLPQIQKSSAVIEQLLILKSPHLELINHNNLKTYLKNSQYNRLFLEKLGYGFWYIELSEGNFDVLAQLNDKIKLSNTPPLNIDEVVAHVNKSIKLNSKAPEVYITMISDILKKISAASVDSTKHATISGMIKQIDGWIPEFAPDTYLNRHPDLISALNDLRFKIDFTNSPEKNIEKAIAELLNEQTSNNRKILYSDLISNWISQTGSAPSLFKKMLTQIKQDKAHIRTEYVIDIAVKIMNKKQLHDAASEWIAQNPNLNIDYLLISKMFTSLTEAPYLDYSIVKKLWTGWEPGAQVVLINKLIKDNKLPIEFEYEDLNFALLTTLVDLKMKNKPELNFIEFSKSAKDYFARNPKSKGAGILLKKLKEKMPSGFFGDSALSADEKDEVLSLLNDIKGQSWAKNYREIIQKIQTHATL